MLKRHSRLLEKGLGLVELMVGITVGLIVVAGAWMVAVNQINEHRRLMMETQIQQDLRTAADLLEKDLRRAGSRGNAKLGVWAQPTGIGTANETAAQDSMANHYLTFSAADTDDARTISYIYGNSAVNTSGTPEGSEYHGFRWNKSNQTLYMQIGLKSDGSENWQPITDPETVDIINFDVATDSQSSYLSDFCDVACTTTGTSPTCPKVEVRKLSFTITGRAHRDPNVVRTLTGVARMRAEAIDGACPT